MVALFSIIGFIGAFFAWKKLSKHYIEKGRSKYVSHIVGIVIGFIVWFVLMVIGVAIFEPTPMNSQDSTSQKASQPIVQKHSYYTDPKLTEESIKSVSPQIVSAEIYEQYAGDNKGLNNIDVHINTKAFWGGAQDWNGVSMTIFDLSKTMLQRKDIAKISYVVWNEDHTIDWARVEVDKKRLPENWSELTYLQFFSFCKPISGTVDAEEWLNEFYAKYSSANPNR